MIDLDTSLTWFNQRLAGARLLHADPERVFDALKAAAAKGEYLCGDGIEAALFARNEPQINLALAAYGRDIHVVRALYKASVPKPGSSVEERLRDGSIEVALLALNDPEINKELAGWGKPYRLRNIYESSPLYLEDANVADQYRVELHHACLNNRLAARYSGSLADQLGNDTIPSLLAVEAVRDAGTLIANPTVGDHVLESLFRRTGIFENLEDGVWHSLVTWASRNPRLADDVDSIREGVKHLLSTAPATEEWAHVLVGVLEASGPQYVDWKEGEHAILERWLAVKGRNDIGEVLDPAPDAYDLCLLIAALYGAPHVDSERTDQGPESPRRLSSARLTRCADYARRDFGKVPVSKALDELKDICREDVGVFDVALVYNKSVLRNSVLREYVEQQISIDDDTWRRYERRCRQLQKDWPWFRASTREQANARFEEEECRFPSAPRAPTVPAGKRFDVLTLLLKRLGREVDLVGLWMIAGFIVIILILLLRSR